MARQPGVSGYVLAGLGTGESPELRQRIVEAVLQKLPAGAPRMLSSVGTPEEVLEAVAQVGTPRRQRLPLPGAGGAAAAAARLPWLEPADWAAPAC